jgi:hypothetical protein
MMHRELRNLLEVEAFEALEAGDLERAWLLAEEVYAEKWELFEHTVMNRRVLELGMRSLETGQNR